MMPLVAHPGEPGGLTLDSAYESYTALVYRPGDEVDSAVGLQIMPASEPAEAARRLRCPALFQIADFDRYVPAESVVKTAELAGSGAPLSCDHFDVWPGHEWFEKAGRPAFLARVLSREASAARSFDQAAADDQPLISVPAQQALPLHHACSPRRLHLHRQAGDPPDSVQNSFATDRAILVVQPFLGRVAHQGPGLPARRLLVGQWPHQLKLPIGVPPWVAVAA